MLSVEPIETPVASGDPQHALWVLIEISDEVAAETGAVTRNMSKMLELPANGYQFINARAESSRPQNPTAILDNKRKILGAETVGILGIMPVTAETCTLGIYLE